MEETTLDPSLHLGFPNHELSFELHFWSGPIEFLSKMVPCICNFNLASIGLGSSSKGLGSNLWLSTNKNVPFCWTLDFGPSSKVALNVTSKNIKN